MSAVALLAAAAPGLHAAEASSKPLGYTTINCLWNSDTLCSPAGLTEKPNYVGTLSAAPTGSTLAVSGTPSWTVDQFKDTHYVRFSTGTKAGRYYKVTANTSETLTVDLGGDNLSGVVAADGVKLIKYWTLGTLFPLATQNTIIESAGNFGFQRKSEILFPDLTSEGINLSSPRKFFLVTGAGWREATSTPANQAADNVIVLPDMFFIVRHGAAPAGTPVEQIGTTYVPMGTVESGPTTISLTTLNSNEGKGSQDNAVAISRPVAVALKDSDLVSSGAFMPSIGTFGFGRRDELFIYDANVDVATAADSGINRSSVDKYFYDGNAGNWVNATTLANADNDLAFQPGTGVVIRKYKTSGGVTSFWKFDPNQ